MRIMLTLLLMCGGSVALAQPRLDTKAMEDIDGRKLPENKRWPKQDVVQRYRPWVADDDNGTLEVSDLKIHDVTNQKAIDIALVSHDRVPGKTICYKKVVVRNCDISNIIRDEEGQKNGLHIDFIRVSGGGDKQPRETEVVIEDVAIHDGTALPIIVQDGKFSSITFRRVSVANTTLGVQIAFINSGYAKEVIVEDSPGLRVALMGKPGSIQKCIVRNSPGATANDVENINGKSGAQITEEGRGAAPRAGGTTMPTTATAAGPAQPLKLTLAGDLRAGQIQATLTGTLPADAAMVIFEAYDTENYRLASPVMVTGAPWQAQFRIARAGKLRIQATVRRDGGADDPPLVAMTQIGN